MSVSLKNCEYYIYHVDDIKQRCNKKIKYADILLKALRTLTALYVTSY